MKRLNENKLDQLFKDGITGSDAPVPFREEDWAAMERMLDARSNKKGIVFRLRYLATAVAALLLLAFCLFLFNKEERIEKSNKKLSVNHKKVSPINTGPDDRRLKSSVPTLSTPGNKPIVIGHTTGNQGRNYVSVPAAEQPIRFKDDDTLPQDTAVKLPTTNTDANVIAAASSAQNTDTIANTKLMAGSAADTAVSTTKALQQDNKPVKTLIKNRPTFTLTILAAPDVNGVNPFSNGRVGTNLGLQLSIQLTKKLSINTGAAYAVKPYQANAGQYSFSNSPATQPALITANCKVLDIPVNVNYQFYAKGNNSLALGTGLSSYFMLRENYRYDYGNYSNARSYSLNIAGQNQHLFGVLNLNATYQRKINSKFSAVVQPYIKLPLTGIGNGQVNLRSTGIALGFSWNINPFGKPK